MATTQNLPPWLRVRNALTKAPDYTAKTDTRDYLGGKKKLPKEVSYWPAQQDSAKRCIECKNYLREGQPESDCSKVVGLVEANGVCDLFTGKNG